MELRFDQWTDPGDGRDGIQGQEAVTDGRAACRMHALILGGFGGRWNGIATGLDKKRSPEGRPWRTTRLERFELPTL